MAITGLMRTYDQSTVYREDFEEAITMISPADYPLVALLNVEDCKSTKVQWVEDSLASLTDLLAQNLASDTDSVAVTMTDGTKFRALNSSTPAIKELIRIDEELMIATHTSSNVVTVTRAAGSTSVAAHTAGATVEILCKIGLEGADAASARAQSRSALYNEIQEFQETIQVSDLDLRLMDPVGITTELDWQQEQRLKEMMLYLERCCISGARITGSASVEKAMGGLRYYISTNKTSESAATFTEAMLEAGMKQAFDAGGHPSILLLNSFQMAKVVGWYKSSVRSEPEAALGGKAINRVITPLGELALILCRNVPAHEVYGLDPEHVSLVRGAGFELQPLAKTGASTKAQVWGAYSLKVRAEKAHFRLYNLATS